MKQYSLEELLDERRAILDEEKLIERAKKEVNKLILDKLDEMGTDKERVGNETVSVVRPGNKIDYDWDLIYNSMSPEDWSAIVVEVPSKDLFEKAIADGRIELSKAKDAVIEKPGNSPYVKVTKK